MMKHLEEDRSSPRGEKQLLPKHHISLSVSGSQFGQELQIHSTANILFPLRNQNPRSPPCTATLYPLANSSHPRHRFPSAPPTPELSLPPPGAATLESVSSSSSSAMPIAISPSCCRLPSSSPLPLLLLLPHPSLDFYSRLPRAIHPQSTPAACDPAAAAESSRPTFKPPRLLLLLLRLRLLGHNMAGHGGPRASHEGV